MSHMKPISRGILVATLIALLSACSSRAPVKEVISDKLGYLSRNFSTESLSPEITKKLPSEDRKANFEKLTIKTETEENAGNSGSNKRSWKTVSTFLNGGNGTVQELQEFVNNDIPYSLRYSLSYKGFVDLRSQRVSLSGSDADSIFVVKEITRLDAIPSVTDKEFEFDYTSGGDHPLAGSYPSQTKCRITGTRPASEIHQKIPGQATDIECEYFKNNVVQGRTKWVLFQEYGFAIILGFTDSSLTRVLRVIDFNG